MKKVRLILPVAAILLAFTAAFSTKASPKALAIVPVSAAVSPCTQVGWCNDANQSQLCRMGTPHANLYQITGPGTCSATAFAGGQFTPL